MTAKWSGWRYLEARFVTILTIRFKGALVPAWPADRSPTRTGPVEADGAVDAQNAPTAPWKTLLVFHELPQGFPHQITHDKPRKSPESYWETRIDPGFALENFDAIGKWRDLDEAYRPIDASGSLPDGTRFDDFAGFRTALLSKPERFVTTLTEKLLTYALGRGLESYDMPVVRGIVRRAAARGYRFSDLVGGIVQSVPFQMRRTGD